MAAPAKFLFDMDFGAPDKTRERAATPSEIAQKVASAEARAYRDGFDAGQREAKAESDRRAALALEEIRIGIQGIAARFSGIETRMETDFDKIRGEARLGRSDPEVRHQREPEASADCGSLDCSNDRFFATEQPHRLRIKRVTLLRARFDSGRGTIREIGAGAE